MEAHPGTLMHVSRSDVRLGVPLFQRRYVWTAAEQWEPLLGDVLTTMERLQGEDTLPHFMGAIVWSRSVALWEAWKSARSSTGSSA